MIKLRETLDKQVAKREKNQSIVSYAMDFFNAVGIHNDTFMVVMVNSRKWSSSGKLVRPPEDHPNIVDDV
eukprot:2369616-Pleurochrysis_carterae.AAC.1